MCISHDCLKIKQFFTVFFLFSFIVIYSVIYLTHERCLLIIGFNYNSKNAILNGKFINAFSKIRWHHTMPSYDGCNKFYAKTRLSKICHLVAMKCRRLLIVKMAPTQSCVKKDSES